MFKKVIVALLLSAVAQVAQAKVFDGPKIDENFRIEGVYRAPRDPADLTDKPLYHSLFFYKLVSVKGRIAVCGAYTGNIFKAKHNYLFLRAAKVGTQEPLVHDLRFFKSLYDLTPTREPSERYRDAVFYFKDRAFGLGLPTRCKTTRKRWSEENLSDDLWLKVPNSVTFTRYR